MELKNIKGKVIKVEVTKITEKTEYWVFEIESENNIMWKLSYLKRKFPDPINSDGFSDVGFYPIDGSSLVKGLMLEIKIPASEIPASLSDHNIFLNKPAIIKYDLSSSLDRYISPIEVV